MSRPCDVCQGHKVLPSPDQKTWVTCPVCDGAGQAHGKEMYEYDVPFNLAGNAANVAFSVQVTSYDFECYFWNYQSAGAFSVTISDTNRYNFMNAAARVETTFGNAQNPFLMIKRHVFVKNALIQGSLNELSGAANAGHLTFIGVNLLR